MLLLSFTLFSCPPPVGDSILFRHFWQCVAMFVCASLGSWPDFLVISMPTSFLTSPSSVAPDREITPVHGTVGVPAGPNTEEKRGGGEIQGSKEGMRYLGGEVNVARVKTCVLLLQFLNNTPSQATIYDSHLFTFQHTCWHLLWRKSTSKVVVEQLSNSRWIFEVSEEVTETCNVIHRWTTSEWLFKVLEWTFSNLLNPFNLHLEQNI